jgi:Beta-propeller repeat
LHGVDDAFVSKLNSSGSALMYSTYLGGREDDVANGVALDSSGSAYVTGITLSHDFPTTAGAFQTAFGAGFNHGFVSKLNSSGSALVYSTFLGGGVSDFGSGIALDSSGNAYVTGVTSSADFPTTAGAFQSTLGGNSDAFVSKFNSSGSALLYSTYLGGDGDDFGDGIALDSSGNAYVTGSTSSADFPTTAGAFQSTLGGNSDAFVSKFNSNGSTLIYSTYLGGGQDDVGFGVAADSSGGAYIAGSTSSSEFPVTAGVLQPTFGGVQDAFVSKISFCTQPKTKSECKNQGWKNFCSPSFKNQGQCVAFVNHHHQW